MVGDFRERNGFREIQKDGILEGLCHTRRRMNPVRIFVESRIALLAVETAFVECNSRAPVIGRDVANGLPGVGILDDTVSGAAMRAEPLPWCWEIQGNEIIVSECLDVLMVASWGSFAK